MGAWRAKLKADGKKQELATVAAKLREASTEYKALKTSLDSWNAQNIDKGKIEKIRAWNRHIPHLPHPQKMVVNALRLQGKVGSIVACGGLLGFYKLSQWKL